VAHKNCAQVQTICIKASLLSAEERWQKGNPNIEFRNPKQYQMTETSNVRIRLVLDLEYLCFEFVSDFGIRA
jgi:hypothetical protein